MEIDTDAGAELTFQTPNGEVRLTILGGNNVCLAFIHKDLKRTDFSFRFNPRSVEWAYATTDADIEF